VEEDWRSVRGLCVPVWATLGESLGFCASSGMSDEIVGSDAIAVIGITLPDSDS
jgi:hypothetical protein